jgi:hypothetical protein
MQAAEEEEPWVLEDLVDLSRKRAMEVIGAHKLTWETFEVRSRIRVGWEKHAWGVRLALAPEESHWSTQDIDVSPTGVWQLPQAWLMVKGVPLSQGQDPFVSATHEVHGNLGIRSPDKRRWTPEERAVWGPRAREEMRRFYALAKDLAVHAATRCDPDARAAVLRFNPHLRTWLYAQLVSDDTRRLLQLASTCPGALIFARCLDEHDRTRDVAARLLKDLIAGRRLDASIDEAVEHWANRFPGLESPRKRACPRWGFMVPPMRPDRQKVLRTQRLLVRRAGPQVATSLLWTLPPLVVVPEDIPRKVRANARWFAVMKCHSTLRTEPEPGTQRSFVAISNLLSAQHANVPRAKSFQLLQRSVGDLLDFILVTGRAPPRDADWRALMRASRAWHRGFARARRNPLEVPDGPLPRRHEAWSAPGVTITLVVIVCGFITEGKEMRHCVATRLDKALRGQCFIFSVVVDGSRLTLELHHDGSLGDFRGVQNRHPSGAEHAAVKAWLHKIRKGRIQAAS